MSCLILLQSRILLWRIKKIQLKHKPFYDDWVNNRTHLKELKVCTWVIYCRIFILFYFLLFFFFPDGDTNEGNTSLAMRKGNDHYYIIFLPLLRRSNFFQLFMEFLCLTHRPQVMDTHTTIVQVQLEHMFVN
jgi:hypothetical protein